MFGIRGAPEVCALIDNRAKSSGDKDQKQNGVLRTQKTEIRERQVRPFRGKAREGPGDQPGSGDW